MYITIIFLFHLLERCIFMSFYPLYDAILFSLFIINSQTPFFIHFSCRHPPGTIIFCIIYTPGNILIDFFSLYISTSGSTPRERGPITRFPPVSPTGNWQMRVPLQLFQQKKCLRNQKIWRNHTFCCPALSPAALLLFTSFVYWFKYLMTYY